MVEAVVEVDFVQWIYLCAASPVELFETAHIIAIFIYVNQASMKKPEVKQYVEFYLDKAAEMAKQVQYIPLPAKAYTTAKEHLNKKRTGTVFGGEPQVGMTIDQIMKKEATF